MDRKSRGTPKIRTAIGFDVHGFDESRKLILGGVRIPGHRGLKGHSDADVLSHAVGDALLGAAGLGDLGSHFPPDDPKWLDAKSLDLLERITKMALNAGIEPTYVDTVIIAETPKLSGYIEKMRGNIADVLGLEAECVSIKATTTEHLGFIGRKEGIAVLAVLTAELVRTRNGKKQESERGMGERTLKKKSAKPDDFPATVFRHPPGAKHKGREILEMFRGFAKLVFHTDGASRGNPGPSGCSVVVLSPEGDPVCAFNWHIGRTTSNVAEYTALVKLLAWLDSLDLHDKPIEIRMDSELVVKHLTGEYRVKSPRLRDLFAEARAYLSKFKHFKLTHIPRGRNELADGLAKEASKG